MERAKGEERFPSLLYLGMRGERFAPEEDLLSPYGERKREYSSRHRFPEEDSLEAQDLPEKSLASGDLSRWKVQLEFDDPIRPTMGLSGTIRSSALPGIILVSPHSRYEHTETDRGFTLLGEKENPSAEARKKEPHEAQRDWKGITRDTAFYIGYQVVFAGILWALPESVTSWTKDQKKATLKKWKENAASPVWDKDKWWINYVFHPYFGGTYYIRARERGFGEWGSLGYSALLSSLYEFGIEAFFEPPSYQDLIVTPVGGYFVGKYIFEPIRERIKVKAELRWYDHLTLILTDPLGAVNSVFERLLGIESDIRVQLRPPVPLQCSEINPCSAVSLKEQYGKYLLHSGISLELNLTWE